MIIATRLKGLQQRRMETTILHTAKFSGLVSMSTYKWLPLFWLLGIQRPFPGSQATDLCSHVVLDPKASSAKWDYMGYYIIKCEMWIMFHPFIFPQFRAQVVKNHLLWSYTDLILWFIISVTFGRLLNLSWAVIVFINNLLALLPRFHEILKGK